jgi:uncharacterized protein with HEPN domain
MPKDDGVYLGHMFDLARKAMAKVQDKPRADFDADENLRLALAHLIQTIGEAARKVSPETCASHPELPWAKITGMRHKIVHDYMSLDEDLVWTVATVHLPELAALLAPLVAREPNS